MKFSAHYTGFLHQRVPMEAFKKHLLERFDGTDEGEVTEYLGCTIERNRSFVSCYDDSTRFGVCVCRALQIRPGSYSRPSDASLVNQLMGWVDSDFAADLDTRRSTSGYLRNLLRDLGYAQAAPTSIWEDNTACIQMSENPFEAFFVDVGQMTMSKERVAWRAFNARVVGR
mmetsp:Transcript_19204/g.39168  ORF Transcript_19204/g.39168 Transcript_19204/m.39168 type:complete len:171 (-) Transcript_19204:36-548(-)